MIRVLLVSLVLLLAAGRAEAARIVVTVEGLRSANGSVFVALFSKPDEFPDGDHSDRHQKVRASVAPVTIVFDNLVPGRYAVGCYHDENGNGQLDTNFIGMPIEGYALSNDIRAIVSRPRFADAAFVVGGEDKRVTLHVRY